MIFYEEWNFSIDCLADCLYNNTMNTEYKKFLIAYANKDTLELNKVVVFAKCKQSALFAYIDATKSASLFRQAYSIIEVP